MNKAPSTSTSPPKFIARFIDNSHSDKEKAVSKVSLNLHIPDDKDVEHLKKYHPFVFLLLKDESYICYPHLFTARDFIGD